MEKITLARKGTKTVFCLDRSPRGAVRVACSVAADLRLITGSRPCDIRVAGECCPLSGASANASTVIVAGLIGSSWIDEAQRMGLIDCSAVSGKRECYRMTTAVLPDGRAAVLIAGSDLLGLEYGLYKLSALSGVSPWHYFADVHPAKREEVTLDASALDITSTEPGIKLRGFFLNDEWPSLGGWVHDTFGGFNELFYGKIFDLLLRLRGNFLWPAMWTGVFGEDGLAYPAACADLADEYGITMGTSHHEPLFRAGEEFSHTMTGSNDTGYGCDWSYHTNRRGIYEFWEYAVRRDKAHRSLITMGMRGERDSKLLGEHATLKDNIDLIKKTITDQKKILADNGLADAPKVLALYKEVEDYYHGDSTAEGLSRWDGLDDMMLLLSDDNFGNTRTLPTPDNRDRAAGWGLYYHFDYHGDPISYEWVNSTPITKAWEQLTSAYAFGIRDLWIANVGDLRPDELPLSYFLDLAFDYDTWSRPNMTGRWLDMWVRQQFGSFAGKPLLDDIASVLNDYTKMNGDRRPESIQENTFSFDCDEYIRELERAENLAQTAERIGASVPAEHADAYFGLVKFPAVASANLRRMMILAGLQRIFYRLGASCANALADEVDACIALDRELVRQYNCDMAGGKWNRMMSSEHVAFFNWNGEGADYPRCERLSLPETGKAFLSLPGEDMPAAGCVQLPVLSDLELNSAFFFVTASGRSMPEYSLECSCDWIKLEKAEPFSGMHRYTVTIDRDKLTGEDTGFIRFACADDSAELAVRIVHTQAAPAEDRRFIETLGYISMNAGDCSVRCDGKDCAWQFIENYGKACSGSMKVLPADTFITDPDSAPYLEYRFTVTHPGEYTVTAFLAPTNDPVKFKGQRFALRLDDGQNITVDSLPENYAAGAPDDKRWCTYVLDNCRRCPVKLHLTAGEHSLRFIHMDAGIVLQKIEIAQKPSDSFYGYPATIHT